MQDNNSPQQKGAARGGRAPLPLRPVTIRMLLNAQRVGEGGSLLVSGREVGVVCVGGRVLEAQASTDTATARSHTYKISDGTGIIQVRHWLDQSATDTATEEVGSYLFATGNVKVFQDKPVLTGGVRPIADLTELTFHLLDCVNVHLRLTRGARAAPATAQPAAAASAGSATAQGDTSLDALIQRAMMQCDRQTGLSAAEVHSKVNMWDATLTQKSVADRLVQLVDEGFFFNVGAGKYSF